MEDPDLIFRQPIPPPNRPFLCECASVLPLSPPQQLFALNAADDEPIRPRGSQLWGQLAAVVTTSAHDHDHDH